ncbi:MAG: uridine diphosphate-N-acetylglucosamine-binding protein YvcK [Ktedonobacterales bacterium]
MDWTSEQRTHALLNLRGKNVVTIGGGTGPFALLSTLKRHECNVTAVVTMSDSGGSSRRLMDELGALPVGDLRQALVALSRKGPLWRDVFTHRFGENGARNGGGRPSNGSSSHDQPGISGHSLGNLIIAALTELNKGNLLHAIEDAQVLLDTAGKVAPVTLARATLCAELEDGSTIEGETLIDTRGAKSTGPLSPITRIYLKQPAAPCDEALRAIRNADVIVIGPGDLYTSILPNFVVDGIADAVRASDAQKVYICNLMTKRGETDGFHASDFVRTVSDYLGGRVDRVVAHDGVFPEHLRERYAADSQYPVEPDLETLAKLTPEVVVDSLLAVYQDTFVRHDAGRLLPAIFTPMIYLG